ncbi:hypothetical protein [Natronosalvus vescus]|uniref:hypothetical protein n=1 Tax=Natronosalvus vescus TaxID=2953881 RepID=UPI0020918AB6|nr:hypothetical protein [Natronosalvus vescus]
MRLRNHEGTPVDPVPFLVVVGLTFMFVLSFGPLYGQALGAGLELSVGVSFALFLAVAFGSYYWQVWTARPETVGVVPASVRAVRLFYLMLVLAVLMIGLAIPLML